MKKKKLFGMLTITAMLVSMLGGCGKQEKAAEEDAPKAEMTDEERIVSAADEGKVGNWGLGNEYEIQALLTKYGNSTDYLVQSFDMDGFDDGSITLASAMTYNELGLVVNDYEGGYGYGDTVGTIDMNDQGVAMLEDNIFCTKEFAAQNPNTVKAFLSASLKGWEYACENPDEAAQIVFEAGSSVSTDHQKYMAKEVAKLIKTDTNGNSVSDYGKMDKEAMQQTLDLAKKYIKLDDSAAADKLNSLTLDYIRDTSYLEAEADIRAIQWAKALDAPLYIVHLANKEGVKAVTQAKDEGYKIYAETCPQYLEFTCDVYKREDGRNFVCSPPMKGEESRQALWEAIKRSDIDTIATDHCPFQSYEKDWGKDDFTKIPNGCAGIENMYPYMLSAANEGKITYEKAVEICSENPAKIFGCRGKGSIAIGKDADHLQSLREITKCVQMHSAWAGQERFLKQSVL